MMLRLSTPLRNRIVQCRSGYRLGLGLFTAPNNHARISAAPPDLAAAAGAVLNLMRVLGASLGVASASPKLSWRVQIAGGRRRLSLILGRHLIEAAQSGLMMLAVFAALAAAISMVRKTDAAGRASLLTGQR